MPEYHVTLKIGSKTSQMKVRAQTPTQALKLLSLFDIDLDLVVGIK